MEFILTKEMKVKVSKEQELQLSKKEKINTMLKKKDVVAFDIYNKGIVIGFAMLKEFDKSKFFLWDFAIDLNYQGKGLGTKALQELFEYMKYNYNCSIITTTYKIGNDCAKHVYEKIGFIQTDVVDEDDVHEVNMVLEI